MPKGKSRVNETVSGTGIDKSEDRREFIGQDRDRGYQRVRIRKSRCIESKPLKCAGRVNAVSRLHRSTGAADYFFASADFSKEVVGVVA